MTYPAYVNYWLQLKDGNSAQAQAATFMTWGAFKETD
jgi:hypothetical protein